MPRCIKIPPGHFGVAHYFYPEDGSKLSPYGWPRGRCVFRVFLPGRRIDNSIPNLESIERPYPLPAGLQTKKEVRGYYLRCIKNGKSLR